MTAKEQLIQELEQASDVLAEEVLAFLLFLKKRQAQKNLIASNEESQLPQSSILDRMGGMPQHLLSVGNLSDRDIRRTVIASRIEQSQQQS